MDNFERDFKKPYNWLFIMGIFGLIYIININLSMPYLSIINIIIGVIMIFCGMMCWISVSKLLKSYDF